MEVAENFFFGFMAEAEACLLFDFVGGIGRVDRGRRYAGRRDKYSHHILFTVHILQGVRRRLRVSITRLLIWKAPNYKFLCGSFKSGRAPLYSND
jgi:hypothetical protein